MAVDEEDYVAVGPWPVWLRVGVVVVVVAAMVVFGIRLASSSHKSHPHAVATHETTEAIYQQQPVAGRDPDGCPERVLCSVLTGPPASLATAIAARFPRAVIARVHSVEYVSADQHRVVVWYRDIQLRVGDVEVQVVVHVPRSADRNTEAAYRIGAERGVRLQRVFFDRVVAITLRGSSAEPTLAQLRAFVADPGLVAT